ncbi:hypothetical protein J6590_098531 [Homalodisca vitripennis]|nr:hypothetical protein J6590_098531 [Homalodisca vitripennis]
MVSTERRHSPLVPLPHEQWFPQREGTHHLCPFYVSNGFHKEKALTTCASFTEDTHHLCPFHVRNGFQKREHSPLVPLPREKWFPKERTLTTCAPST